MPTDCCKEVYSSVEHLTRLNLIEKTENGEFVLKEDRVPGVGASISDIGPKNVSRIGIGEFLSAGDVIIRLSGTSDLLGKAVEIFSDDKPELNQPELMPTSAPKNGLKSLAMAILGIR